MFTCFSKLPLELRQKIWENARPRRLISIYPEVLATTLSWNTQIEAQEITILQVSREARAEGLRGYTKFACKFSCQRRKEPSESANYLRAHLQQSSVWQSASSLDNPTTCLYINFSLDTIYLEYSLDMPSFDIATRFLGAELERVRNFALDFEYCAFDFRSYTRLRSLKQIQEPIFVITDSTVGSRRRDGKSRASLELLEEDYRKPGQNFPFRFMFSDLSNPPEDSFEQKLKQHGKIFQYF
jgi:hypothetical protein